MNSFHTAERERGIVGRPLPTKRESRSSWVTSGHQRLRSIPGHQRSLVYTRASGGRSSVLRSGFLLLRSLRLWSGILLWGGFLLLGAIQMDRLRIQLSGRRCAISDINTHAKRPHDVHPNQAGR